MRKELGLKMTALSLIFIVISACGNNKKTTAEPYQIEIDTSQSQTFERIFDAAQNAKLIGLGEQTHGAGTVFTFKVDFIKWLHQNKGVNVIALESGMYDVLKLVERMHQGESLVDIAPNNIFYMYSKTTEVQQLLRYIDATKNTENPLTLVGFDSQHTGETSLQYLVNDLQQYVVNELKLTSSIDWSLLQKVLENDSFDESEKTTVTAFLTELENAFNTQTDSFWHRIVIGLHSQALRQWQQSDSRSYEMGRNIEWQANQYANEKMVIWAHSYHLMKKGGPTLNAGEHLANSFGQEYFMLHFSAISGSFLNFVNMEIQNVAALKDGSVEYDISRSNSFDQHFVNGSSALWRNKSIWAFNYDVQFPWDMWSSQYDGTVVFDNITPANFDHSL